MKVAEITITYGKSFGASQTQTAIGFEDSDKAKAEFDRLKDYLNRREKRANDLEKTITVAGIGEFTCPGDEILGIAWLDYSQANIAEAGMRDAFPNLFKR